MTNLSPLYQALHDGDDKEIADALRYLGRAERIAAALNAQASAEDVALVDKATNWYGNDSQAAWQRIRASLEVGK
jgi:hypothetical protein